MALPFEEFCPISESLLGRLYRASPEGINVLVRTVPPSTRAMLAYYCSRRAHLESIGLSIAGTLSAEDLYDVAGRAGWDLHARARNAQLAEAQTTKSRYEVSLATGALWNVSATREPGE